MNETATLGMGDHGTKHISVFHAVPYEDKFKASIEKKHGVKFHHYSGHPDAAVSGPHQNVARYIHSVARMGGQHDDETKAEHPEVFDKNHKNYGKSSAYHAGMNEATNIAGVHDRSKFDHDFSAYDAKHDHPLTHTAHKASLAAAAKDTLKGHHDERAKLHSAARDAHIAAAAHYSKAGHDHLASGKELHYSLQSSHHNFHNAESHMKQAELHHHAAEAQAKSHKIVSNAPDRHLPHSDRTLRRAGVTP
jgi:hypothetical protein